jgi:hypothetical protein
MIDYFEAENTFYLHSEPSRISKFLAHARLYEMSLGLPGHFLEAGVFKGASFCRFRKIGKLLHPDHYRQFFGFDTFGQFPEAEYGPDKELLKDMNAISGEMSVDREELLNLLAQQGLADNVELVAGDVRQTLPDFLAAHEEHAFAFVNIDVDLYEAVKSILEHVFPRVVRGGIILLDDYEGFPGARKAVDEYLEANNRKEIVQKLPFAFSPCHIVKE